MALISYISIPTDTPIGMLYVRYNFEDHNTFVRHTYADPWEAVDNNISEVMQDADNNHL